MTRAHIGHMSNGIQAHSCGRFYPWNVLITGDTKHGECLTYRGETGETVARYSFNWDNPETYRAAYRSAERSAQVELSRERGIRASISELAELAEMHLELSGGFTLDRFGATPASGYAVSLPNRERVHALDSMPLQALLVAEAPLMLPEIMLRRVPYVAHWGGWIGGGLLYLDESIVIADKSEALRFAQIAKQKAIYDLNKKETIYLDDETVPDSFGSLYDACEVTA